MADTPPIPPAGPLRPAARIYRLRLLALPGVERPERALALVAKRLLRSHGFRLLTCEPERAETTESKEAPK